MACCSCSTVGRRQQRRSASPQQPWLALSLPLLLLLLCHQCRPLLLLSRSRRQIAKEVAAGTTTLFECQPRYPENVLVPHQVQWRRDGSHQPVFDRFDSYEPTIAAEFAGRLSIHSEATLQLKDVRPGDQGVYRCWVKFRADSPGDGDEQCAIYLFVFEAPRIRTKLPPTLVRRPHSRLSLDCDAYGRPQPDTAWLHNGRRVRSDESGGIQVSRTGRLTIESIGFQHGGLYECLASNKFGKDRAHITVLIEGGVYIQMAPANVTKREGQRLELPCVATGYPGNVTYAWFRSGRDLRLLEQLRHRYFLDNGTLVIPTLMRHDTGWYRCVPSNGRGNPPQARAYVDVIHPPMFEGSEQRTQFLAQGKPGLVHCPVLANPPATEVHWTHNYSAAGSTSLPYRRLDLVGPGHAGVWKCRCLNSLGWGDWSHDIRVLVQSIPYISQRPQTVIQQLAGSEASIFCNLDQLGLGTEVLWFKDAAPVPLTSGRFQCSPNSLKILQLRTTDSGRYQCLVNNSLVQLFAESQLLVEARPVRAPYNLTVITDPFSAHLAWTPGYDRGRELNYVVWYKLVKMQAWSTLRVPVPGASQASIFGLVPQSHYAFFIRARAGGTRERDLESERQYAMTKPLSQNYVTQEDITGLYPQVPGPPVDLAAKVENGREARISWQLSNSSVPVLYCIVQYAIDNRHWQGLPPVAAPVTDLTVDAAAMVTARTAFLHLRVVTCGSLGCSKPSSELSLDAALLLSDATASYKIDVGMTTLWAILACVVVAASLGAAVLLWTRCSRSGRRLTRIPESDPDERATGVAGGLADRSCERPLADSGRCSHLARGDRYSLSPNLTDRKCVTLELSNSYWRDSNRNSYASD